MRDSWESNSLADLTDLITKGTTPSSIGYEFLESGINFIKAESITPDGKFLNEKFSHIGNDANLALSRSILKKDDILFSIAGVIGRVAVVNESILPANTNQALSIIRLKNQETVSLDFVKYYLGSVLVQQQIRRISVQLAQANFSLADVGKINIVAPLLPQQKKIAQILSTADTVLAQTEAAIAKYQALKQGMLHDLFTRGIDTTTGQLRASFKDAPELYKETDLGFMPREWEVEALETIASYVDYRGKTPPKSNIGIFLVTAKNIKTGFIDYESSKEYILPIHYKNAMTRGLPINGDVLITTEAPMGNVAQIDNENVALAQRVIKYRCFEDKMNNDYLKYTLMSEYFQRELESESTGSTVKGIKGSRLHKMKVLKPNLSEQNLIIKKLQTIDQKIHTEQQTLAKYVKLKAGLMQDLLSGVVKVEGLVNDVEV